MFLFDFIPKSQCILLDQFRFIVLFEVRTQPLASPDGRGTSRREGERDVQTVRGGMQFRIRNRCSGSEGSLSVESVR